MKSAFFPRRCSARRTCEHREDIISMWIDSHYAHIVFLTRAAKSNLRRYLNACRLSMLPQYTYVRLFPFHHGIDARVLCICSVCLLVFFVCCLLSSHVELYGCCGCCFSNCVLCSPHVCDVLCLDDTIVDYGVIAVLVGGGCDSE